MMSQSHFTLSLRLKQQSDPKALSDQLTPMMPALFTVEDSTPFGWRHWWEAAFRARRLKGGSNGRMATQYGFRGAARCAPEPAGALRAASSDDNQTSAIADSRRRSGAVDHTTLTEPLRP